MGVSYFCDGCGSNDFEDEFDLTRCDGDCWEEFCDDCLKAFGNDRFCEDCYREATKEVPNGDLLNSPLLNPRVITEWRWPWEVESA